MSGKWGWSLTTALLTLAIGSAAVNADSIFYFNNITNSTSNTGAQFKMTVIDAGSSIRFRFDNTAAPGTIAEIYFYDGHLLQSGSMGTIIADSGDSVSFTQYAATGDPVTHPKNLPGYDDKETTAMLYAADAGSDAPLYGISKDEYLTVEFALQDGVTYADVVSDLTKTNKELSLVVGLHVLDADGSQSDSFLNNLTPYQTDVVLVPVPPSAWGGGTIMGAMGLFALARRKASHLD